MAYAHPLAATRPTSSLSFGALPARLMAFATLARQRRALTQMTSQQLDDLGLSTQQARTESNRPFWDVPTNWKA